MTILPTIGIVIATAFLAIIGVRARLQASTESRLKREEGSVRRAEAAHAARARKVLPDDQTEPEVYLPHVVDDFFGGRVDTRGKYVGVVAGKSCVQYGFKDGAIYLGDRLTESTLIGSGDFVVVSGVAQGSNVGRRIRRVEAVDSDQVTFSPDDAGAPHRPRTRAEIVAKITHILA